MNRSRSFAVVMDRKLQTKSRETMSGERTRLACISRRLAESGSDGSGETPEPARETRALPGKIGILASFAEMKRTSLYRI